MYAQERLPVKDSAIVFSFRSRPNMRNATVSYADARTELLLIFRRKCAVSSSGIVDSHHEMNTEKDRLTSLYNPLERRVKNFKFVMIEIISENSYGIYIFETDLKMSFYSRINLNRVIASQCFSNLRVVTLWGIAKSFEGGSCEVVLLCVTLITCVFSVSYQYSRLYLVKMTTIAKY